MLLWLMILKIRIHQILFFQIIGFRFHENGTVGLYPMFAENRRKERREDIFEALEEEGFNIENIVDYTSAEEEDIFLEGTGSLLVRSSKQKSLLCTFS